MPRGTAVGGSDEARRRDGASIVALEAVLAALAILAAAIVVIATMGPGSSSDRPEAPDLQATAEDTLRVIAASDGNTSRRARMADLVADAIHGRPDDLAQRVHRTMPPGAEATLHLGNGLAEMTLVRDSDTPDDNVHARRPISPDWPTLHIVPDLRVYPADVETEMNVTALPLWAATPKERSQLDHENLSFPNDFEAPLDEDGDAPDMLANLSIPNATENGTGGFPLDDVANITSNTTRRNDTLVGEAPYRTDSDDVFEATHDSLAASLEDATLDVADDDVDLGGETTVTWDFSPVSDVLDSDLASGTAPEVHLAFFRPIPRDQPALPGHAAAQDFPGRATDGSLTLAINRSEIVGRWMAVAQLNATLQGNSQTINQSARLVDTFTVRSPGTTGDPTTLYDLEIVAWYEDW